MVSPTFTSAAFDAEMINHAAGLHDITRDPSSFRMPISSAMYSLPSGRTSTLSPLRISPSITRK